MVRACMRKMNQATVCMKDWNYGDARKLLTMVQAKNNKDRKLVYDEKVAFQWGVVVQRL